MRDSSGGDQGPHHASPDDAHRLKAGYVVRAKVAFDSALIRLDQPEDVLDRILLGGRRRRLEVAPRQLAALLKTAFCRSC